MGQAGVCPDLTASNTFELGHISGTSRAYLGQISGTVGLAAGPSRTDVPRYLLTYLLTAHRGPRTRAVEILAEARRNELVRLLAASLWRRGCVSLGDLVHLQQ